MVGAQRQPWVLYKKNARNPERVRRGRNPFRVERYFSFRYPGFSRCSNHGLKLANAFGVINSRSALAFGVIKFSKRTRLRRYQFSKRTRLRRY
jgi:hypothetical protein